jgi:hypothetical protein
MAAGPRRRRVSVSMRSVRAGAILTGKHAAGEEKTQAIDRYRGSLLGLAAGDALGTTLEFRRPGSFRPISDMVGGGPFNLNPGEWTDDTSMALCLAKSPIQCGGFDPADQMRRYVRWYREGHLSSNGRCFDIGGTVRSALSGFERTRDPYSGSTDPHSAGNGSLMRLAPVPLFYAAHPEEAIERAADSSRTTHGARTAVDACWYFAGLIVGGLHGESKERLLSPGYCPVLGYWQRRPRCPEIACHRRGLVRAQGAAADPGNRLRGGVPAGGAVGLPEGKLVRGGGASGRKPGRRRLPRAGHHGAPAGGGIRSPGRGAGQGQRGPCGGIFDHLVLDFNGQEIHLPQRRSYYPEDQYVDWHAREVFQGAGALHAGGHVRGARLKS